MLTIGVLAISELKLMSLSAMAVFQVANNVAGEPFYDMHLIFEAGGPVQTNAGFAVMTEPPCEAAFDTLLVGATTGAGSGSPVLLTFVRRVAKQARRAASFCRGSFVLAEAGLLAGRRVPARRPTLMILVAPFAVGFSGRIATFVRVDAFEEALFLIARFVFAVPVGRLRDLRRCCPFRISWWAVSFPIAAMAVAALGCAGQAQAIAADALALLLLGLATVIVVGLAMRTLVGIARGELRQPAGRSTYSVALRTRRRLFEGRCAGDRCGIRRKIARLA